MKRIGAGEYSTKCRIEFLNDAAEPTAMNEPVQDWDLYCSRWCRLHPVSGREFVAGDKTQAEVQYRAWVRYDTTTVEITPKMRLKAGSKVYNILRASDSYSEHREIVMDLREVVL